MSLRLAEEMTFHICARSCANRVGFYTTPYIQVHILGIGLSNVRKHTREILITYEISTYVMVVGLEVSLLLIHMT
jgi:hypothetical protein